MSTIMISCWNDIRFPYNNKKPSDDEYLASVSNRQTNGRTDPRSDVPAYRDARTHLKMRTVFHGHTRMKISILFSVFTTLI